MEQNGWSRNIAVGVARASAKFFVYYLARYLSRLLETLALNVVYTHNVGTAVVRYKMH